MVLVEHLGILSNFSNHLPEYSPVILTIEISRKKKKSKGITNDDFNITVTIIKKYWRDKNLKYCAATIRNNKIKNVYHVPYYDMIEIKNSKIDDREINESRLEYWSERMKEGKKERKEERKEEKKKEKEGRKKRRKERNKRRSKKQKKKRGKKETNKQRKKKKGKRKERVTERKEKRKERKEKRKEGKRKEGRNEKEYGRTDVKRNHEEGTKRRRDEVL